MADLNNLLIQSKMNKRKRKKEGTAAYCMVRNDVSYYALITDAEYDKFKGEIHIDFTVFVDSTGIKRQVKFFVNSSSSIFYDEICETMDTNGNPTELIGKAVVLHFEKHGEYQNVKVKAAVEIQEVKEYLDGLKTRKSAEKKPKSDTKKKKQKPEKKKKDRDIGSVYEMTEVEDDFAELDDEIGDMEA